MALESICKKPIKLMFAISLYEINGACAVAKNLIDNLNKENFEILLMTEKIAKRHFELDSDIRIINLDIKSKKGMIKKIVNIFCHINRIKNTILAERPDIILSFGVILNCYILFSLPRAERKDIKIIISEHSELFFANYNQPYLKYKILKKIYKLMIFLFYKRADCIIAVSQNIANSLKKLLREKNKIEVIYNPVDILKIKKLCKEKIIDFDFNENIHYIAIVSRLSPEKGINCLIEAFVNLIHKIDAYLIIIGDGEERNRLEDLVKRYNVGDKIKFMGWQDNPFKYLKNTEVFVLSSIYEGFPNVILEAMACGIPVVALRSSGGIEEIIDDGIDGILVNSKDPVVLSVAIYNLLLNKVLREKIIAEAYKKVNRFEVSRIAREYESTLTDLISNN